MTLEKKAELIIRLVVNKDRGEKKFYCKWLRNPLQWIVIGSEAKGILQSGVLGRGYLPVTVFLNLT